MVAVAVAATVVVVSAVGLVDWEHPTSPSTIATTTSEVVRRILRLLTTGDRQLSGQWLKVLTSGRLLEDRAVLRRWPSGLDGTYSTGNRRNSA